MLLKTSKITIKNRFLDPRDHPGPKKWAFQKRYFRADSVLLRGDMAIFNFWPKSAFDGVADLEKSSIFEDRVPPMGHSRPVLSKNTIPGPNKGSYAEIWPDQNHDFGDPISRLLGRFRPF